MAATCGGVLQSLNSSSVDERSSGSWAFICLLGSLSLTDGIEE